MGYLKSQFLCAAQRRDLPDIAAFVLASAAINASAMLTLIHGLDRATPGFASWALGHLGSLTLAALMLGPPIVGWGTAGLIIRTRKGSEPEPRAR
jgi:hypothetical protein